ncbi:MAG: hypothetical protein EBX49_03395 [Synechococcaceae bacterium WB8_1B_136]|nr:hypothetical protein [Synechococcaceae bacterium WB8_1B_136]
MSRTVVRTLPLVVALAALLGSAVGAAAQQAQGKQAAQPSRSVIQKLRDFLGLNPPVAVGGSRSGSELGACLLSPWPGQPVGVTTPVLLAAGPLNELRLEQGDQLLWQQRASSTQAIEGPVAWPIRPLRPGEEITLKVRPRGASGGDFASYSLRTADAAALEANQRQLAAMGSDPNAWHRYIEGLSPKQVPQAAALLSSPTAPAALRQSLQCTAWK